MLFVLLFVLLICMEYAYSILQIYIIFLQQCSLKEVFLYEDSLLDIKKSRETFIARLTQLFVLIFIGLEHFCVIKIVPPFLVIRSARGDPSGELRICLLNLCIFQWPLKLGRNHDSPS